MLIFVIVFGVEALLSTLGLVDYPWALGTLAALNAAAAFLFRPLVALVWLIGPPMLAVTRRRRWWAWLLASIGLGPFAFVVAFLPKSDSKTGRDTVTA